MSDPHVMLGCALIESLKEDYVSFSRAGFVRKAAVTKKAPFSFKQYGYTRRQELEEMCQFLLGNGIEKVIETFGLCNLNPIAVRDRILRDGETAFVEGAAKIKAVPQIKQRRYLMDARLKKEPQRL